MRYDWHKIIDRRMFYYFSVLGLIFILITMGVVTVWQFWPYRILTINEPLRVLTTHVVAGQPVLYQMNYCKSSSYLGIRASVQITFINHIIYTMPPTIGPLEKGCNVITDFLIMPKLPSGIYKIHMDRVYKVNPIRDITIEAESNLFWIYDE